MDQLDSAQAANSVTANENFDALKPAAFGGKRASACVALTWAYYGGRWGGTEIADGTLTLDPSSDNYIVFDLYALEFLLDEASDPLWDDTENYARVYKVTTSASAVTDEEDHRTGPGGLFGGGGGVSGGGGDASTNTSVSVDSEVALFSGTDGKTLKRATGSGIAKATSGVFSVIPALQCIAIAASDEATALTAGTNKVRFINPFSTAFIVSAVVASLSTAQASGSIFTVDINEAGTTILSTKLTIDNTENNSSTAATAAVISDSSIAAYAEITVDIDQVGNGTAKGLKVYLIGWPA